MSANKNKGWTFRFAVYMGLEPDKDIDARVVVLGEVGDVNLNTWDDEEALFYEDEEHARSIAMYVVLDKYDMPMDRVQWIETSDYHPDHLLGLKVTDIGVWI